MQRGLWLLVVALLAVDLLMLRERHEHAAGMRNLQAASAEASLKARYAGEEHQLVAAAGAAPAPFPRLSAAPRHEDAVQFVLLASAEDCTNALEDEITKLNQMARRGAERVAGVQGFFLAGDRPARAEEVIRHLSPPPAFAVTVLSKKPDLPGATTPLVLVIRSRDGRILDAHKPIPQDYTGLDAFYSRWSALLGLS